MKVHINKKHEAKVKIHNRDCWNLDHTLAKVILPALKKFKKVTTHAYNWEFKNIEEWYACLDMMIMAFQAIVEDVVLDYEEDTVIQEGLDLFAKHFRNLWD